jgi:hypothetical protein
LASIVVLASPTSYIWETIIFKGIKEVMKKYAISILLVLSMALMLVGTAAAAPQAAGSAKLVSVQYVPGKGPVFTFKVKGKFSKSELNGSLHVEGGSNYSLSCTQVDENTVKCSTSAKVAGVKVSLTWGGSTFWATVPEAPIFCYGIYDWTSTRDAWMLYGSHCQETHAEYGDSFTWDNPQWGESPYIFLPGSLVCPFYQPGDAYYYPGCPEMPL